MIPPLARSLSEQLFAITREEELLRWIREVERTISGLTWRPLGGIENNVHTVEVASDPALALVERPTNGIDALLDLWPIAEAFERLYLGPALLLDAEKNA